MLKWKIFFLFYFSKCGGAPGRKYSRCPVWRCAIKKSKLQTPCGAFWGFFYSQVKVSPRQNNTRGGWACGICSKGSVLISNSKMHQKSSVCTCAHVCVSVCVCAETVLRVTAGEEKVRRAHRHLPNKRQRQRGRVDFSFTPNLCTHVHVRSPWWVNTLACQYFAHTKTCFCPVSVGKPRQVIDVC